MNIDLAQHGITVKNGYGFFWSGVLSNWYRTNFIYENIKFSSAEQYMMYYKALLFEDTFIAKQILQTNDPKRIKSLGRTVKNFDKEVWDNVNVLIVSTGCYEKFSQNKTLANILIATENLELVEASPYDTIYGIGLHVTHPDVIDKSKWKGQNLLGQILVDVRQKL